MADESLESLYDRLRKSYTKENLTRITAGILEYYRGGLLRKLRSFLKGKAFPDLHSRSDQQFFSRLLLLYHPDRLRLYLEGMERNFLERDREGLSSYAHIFSLANLASPSVSEGHGGSPPTRERPERSREEYGDEAWERSGAEDYGYDGGDFDFVSREPFDDFDDSFRREYDEWMEPHPVRDILSALKMREYGNLDVDLTYRHLELLEGDLDLSSFEINDLEGLRHCLYVTSLNLSDNEIDDLSEIAFLPSLKELYLSGNLVENLEPLRGLKELEVLDLSSNEIVHLSALFDLPALKLLYISGNSVSEEELAALRSLGVVVL